MSASMDKLAQIKLTELVVNPKDDIVDGPFGSRLKASEYVDAGVPIVRLQNIDRNRFVEKNIKFVTKAKAEEIARHHFVSGDILISKLGDPLGEACIAPAHFPYGILVADVVRVRPDKRKVDTNFLAYALNSAPVVQQFKAETKGTTRPRVNLKKIRDLRVPIVESIAQQRKIVAEIEKQFTRLDAGVAALCRMQANLKRYRAAVLKAACEGRLVPTEAELARAEGRTCETGEQHLARILADRRKNWHGRGKYKEPTAPDTTSLPPLPEGWVWATCAQIGEAITGFTPSKSNPEFFGGDVPFFKPTDLDAGYNVREFRDSLTEAGAQNGRVLPPLAILVTCIGATIGKAGLARVRCTTNQQINALVVPDESVSPKYVYWYFCGPSGQRQILDNASATTLPILNKSRFEALPIPLPPFAEQERIVAKVEHRMSVIDELEAAVTSNLQRATRLRQSILQRAFADS